MKRFNDRLGENGDYLLMARNPNPVEGTIMDYTERAYLVPNILNFFKNHPEVKQDNLAIYELKEINAEE